MDPRHKLYKQLNNLTVDPANEMSARADSEAAQAAASSGITPDIIKQKLQEGLGATHVEIEDMSGMYSSWLLLAGTVTRGF
jgi:hypothetical protein